MSNNINFNNIQNNAKIRLGKISNRNSDFTYNEFEPIINAVEIDWNGAEVDKNKVINTTEELLTWIKEGRSSQEFTEEQIQSLKDAANIITLIKEYFIGQQTQLDGYYWYIGTTKSSSISNIQTNNTVPGWHEIGPTLSGFVLDTNDEANEVILNNNPVYYNYYVIIPDGLAIYDFFGFNLINDGSFNEVSCNIQGYKAYQYVYGQSRTASGIIIKQ